MPYLYLAIAIILEVIATTALKSSLAFSKPLPSLIAIIGYSGAFYCLSVALQSMSVGIAYAIWAGIGIALITLIAAFQFKEIPDLPAIIGLVFIVAGVIIIQLFSKMPHA